MKNIVYTLSLTYFHLSQQTFENPQKNTHNGHNNQATYSILTFFPMFVLLFDFHNFFLILLRLYIYLFALC